MAIVPFCLNDWKILCHLQPSQPKRPFCQCNQYWDQSIATNGRPFSQAFAKDKALGLCPVSQVINDDIPEKVPSGHSFHTYSSTQLQLPLVCQKGMSFLRNLRTRRCAGAQWRQLAHMKGIQKPVQPLSDVVMKYDTCKLLLPNTTNLSWAQRK